MTRTTIDLDPLVLRELRRRSRAEGRAMGAIASDLLVRALDGAAPVPAPTFEWRSADLGRPLVDVEDREAVQAILDAG